MTDREMVIKGLECCILHDPDDKPKCDSCPYDGACLNRLKHDALQLLKAQEPRVLTLEEARNAEVVWVEDRSTREIYPCIVKNNMNDSKLYKYGVQWRCWSAKPTDEQRKEAKWDARIIARQDQARMA